VTPNERLRAQRLRRGWTLDSVAERLNQLAITLGHRPLGVDATMVGKWERGIHQPRGINRELLCTLYSATAEELGLWQPAGHESTLDAMQRRAFLQGLAAAGVTTAAATSAASQRLVSALRQPSRTDQRTVTELEHVTIDLEGLESQVGPRALLGPVVGHLNTVVSLLQGTPKGALRRQLASIAGETAGLAG
jgi:transcriptional regulator with XRE-family HTH domain